MPTGRILYKDLDMNFIPHPITGDVGAITDEDSVKRSIKSLVMTGYYERPYQPNLGCAVRGSLFENMNRVTAQVLSNSIRRTIIAYEPRAKNLEVSVQANFDDNGYIANIRFSVVNSRGPITLSLFLERIR